MAIIGIQRRLREIGRIRTGDQVATANGKTRPSKLSAFRLTSADEQVLEKASELYGGTVQPWKEAPTSGQFELYTEATGFDVLFPANDIGFSQFYESWIGGTCKKRCDGERETISDSPCSCDQENRECRPTTRLNLILADLKGLGTWRLESHGYYAASEMAGLTDMIASLPTESTLIPARLLLTQRQVKKVVDGKTTTNNFSVPVLDLNVSMNEVLTAGRVPGVTPIQTETPALPSVREQFEAAKEPAERPKRANSTAPLPSTGLRPKGMSSDVGTEVLEKTSTKASTDDRTAGGASTRSLRRLYAVMKGNKDIPNDSDEDRHAWAEVALDHPVASFNDLTQVEVSKLMDVAEGKVPLIADEPPATEDAQRPF
jgi:hypothetical protein